MDRQAIIYLRVSTKRQADHGVSLDAQQQAARRWCEYRGYQIAQVYEERGVSGRKSANRPELQAALGALSSGDALVVYSLSRLARSTVDAGRILSRLEQLGADFVSVTENLDTTSSAGKLLFNIMAAVAQFESDQISERVSGAMGQCKASGRVYHNQPIYGYDVEGGQLVPNAAEQRVIRLMRRMHAPGPGSLSYQAIARKLTRDGVPTKRGGQRWYASTVRNILRNALHVPLPLK